MLLTILFLSLIRNLQYNLVACADGIIIYHMYFDTIFNESVANKSCEYIFNFYFQYKNLSFHLD